MATNMRIYRRTEKYSKAEVSDIDTIYFHQTAKENDATQFLKTAHKEFSDLLSKGFFELILCSIVPEVETLSPAIWAMKQIKRVHTREIYKYKARLNLDGSKIRPVLQCSQTYAPVAAC